MCICFDINFDDNLFKINVQIKERKKRYTSNLKRALSHAMHCLENPSRKQTVEKSVNKNILSPLSLPPDQSEMILSIYLGSFVSVLVYGELRY